MVYVPETYADLIPALPHECTSTTRPPVYPPGWIIVESDTRLAYYNAGSDIAPDWQPVYASPDKLATDLIAGSTKLSRPAADPANPIAVGDNDQRMADLSSHLGMLADNPHGTTAAQVGAPDLTAFGALQAELDAHEARTDNPHLTTHAQVGPVLYDPNSADAITAKHVTDFDADRWDTHAVATNNPHGTTAAQVGAPPTTRQVLPGTGLAGGGDLSVDRTLALADQVIPDYTPGVVIPFAEVAFDAQGRAIHVRAGTPSGTPPAATDRLGALLVQTNPPPDPITGLVPYPIALTTDSDLDTMGAVPNTRVYEVQDPLVWSPDDTLLIPPGVNDMTKDRTLSIKVGGIFTDLYMDGSITAPKLDPSVHTLTRVNTIADRNALTNVREGQHVYVTADDQVYISTSPDGTAGSAVVWRNAASTAPPDPTKLTYVDMYTDYVVSGFLPALPSPAAITLSIPPGVAYAGGRRVEKTLASDPRTYTASTDTYVDIDSSGNFVYTEVGNGAAEPALGANAIRLVRVVTNATEITAVADLRDLTAEFASGMPLASEIEAGIVELATAAETVTGTDATRAVTPAALQGKTATETARGIVELATAGEATAGTNASLAVHPAALKARMDAFGIGSTAKQIAQDLNTLRNTGVYMFDRNDILVVNEPTIAAGESSWMYMLHIEHNANWSIQHVWDFNGVVRYSRTSRDVGGVRTWDPWKALPFTDQVVKKAGDTMTGDLVMGAGVQIDFADELGDKEYYYQTGYRRGVEASALYDVTAQFFRVYDDADTPGTTTPRLELDTVNNNLKVNGLDLKDFTNEARSIPFSGGGTISFGAVLNKLKWTARFIMLPVPLSLSTDRHISLVMPTSGVLDHVGAERASVDGITINGWEALYVKHPRGSAAGSAKTWTVIPYNTTLTESRFEDEEVFLIAHRNGDNGNVYLRNGVILDHGQTLEDGGVIAQATTAEAQTLASNARFLTPLGLRDVLGQSVQAYREGLELVNDAATRILVQKGSAWVPNENRFIQLAADTYISFGTTGTALDVIGSTLYNVTAAGWYFVYLTPTGHVLSATAPAAPYRGKARTHPTNLSWRFLRSIYFSAANALRRFQVMQEGFVRWIADQNTTLRAVAGAINTVGEDADISAFCPPTSDGVWASIYLINSDNGSSFYVTAAGDGLMTVGGSETAGQLWIVVGATNAARQANSGPIGLSGGARTLRHRQTAAGASRNGSIDILGYYEGR